ncbi:hypothetical protein HZC21_01090 [Candidatus Peregrinibacteria bacterium]|nr:hypothetical protein [Candidatus Peregrinibacteria bacterium]
MNSQPKNNENWDSGASVVKFVLGLILLSLLWPVIFGGQRIWFIIKEGTPTEPIKIDLTKNEFNTKPHKGFLEITGYPQAQISLDSESASYMENIQETTYKNFYFTLQPGPNAKSPAPVIVERKESFSGLFGYYFESDRKKFPAISIENQPIAIKGIAGYHMDDISGDLVSAFWEQNIKIADNAILLAESRSPPSLKLTLLWFIPVSALFLMGVYLILHWIYLLKSLWHELIYLRLLITLLFFQQ